MRILNVRFKNLNSLAGEWEIDLTHPAYVSDGIFAITGPTGAGKSTILDAICLALYGRTPRLNKVTQSANEIMSRQTGDCFAEVTFETPSGRYRCHWSQHRSRRKSDGALQSPKQEITHADSGAIIESKITQVAHQIDKITGMDFDRFTRSMLLAQGGFAVFLQAAPDERAPILEQITGTEIYSLISIRVHEHYREEQKKLDLLQAETAGIVILEPEQEHEIQHDLEKQNKAEIELNLMLKATSGALDWLKTILSLQQELLRLADEQSQLQSAFDAFKPERNKLDQAVNAASLDGTYASLLAIRKQQKEDEAALMKEQAAIPGLESRTQEQAELLQSAELRTVRVKDELNTVMPILQKVRALDQTLTDRHQRINEAEKNCQVDELQVKANQDAQIQERTKRAKAQKQLEKVDAYLKDHAQDEWLIGGLAGVKQQLNELQLRQTELQQKETDQEQAAKHLKQTTKLWTDSQKQFAMRQQALEQATLQLQQGKEVLSQLLGDRLLREYRTEKETLLREMAFLAKIAELETHRTKLEDGMPCPLCGATEHPFAEGNVPIPDEVEHKIDGLTRLISQAENQETVIAQFEDVERLARNDLSQAENIESATAKDVKVAEQALIEVNSSVKALQVHFVERREAVIHQLVPLGITELSEADIASLFKSLDQRLKTWQKQVKQKSDIETGIIHIDSEVKRLDALIESLSSALAKNRDNLDFLDAEFARIQDERNTLYGDKNPDDEQSRLKRAISDAETAEKQIRDQYHDHQQKYNAAKTRVEALNQQIEQREPQLQTQEHEFTTALIPVGFSDEEQFLQARLSPDQRKALSTQAKALDDHQTDLKARQEDRKTRLAEEMARNITEQSLEELELQHQAYEQKLNVLRNQIAGLQHKLSENAVARERIKTKQTAIEAQKKECSRWKNLHELIGSADGKKYRNFAQGLTFEMMISHANRQLQKMTDRYLLVRDVSQPLELNVVDNYQAGEIRSTKNLSGGESFIVSLSLALGLSQMASQNVRVDSLFLDEGFGTLDEDALDTALETLSNLQQDGKMIGVISHVSALKDRIGTQIQVTPQIGGRSQLSGPGCQSVVIN